MKAEVSVSQLVIMGVGILAVAAVLIGLFGFWDELKGQTNTLLENPVPAYNQSFEIPQAFNGPAYNLFENLNTIPTEETDECRMELLGFGDFFRYYNLNLKTVNGKVSMRITDSEDKAVAIKELDAAKKYCVIEDYGYSSEKVYEGKDITISKNIRGWGLSDQIWIYVDGQEVFTQLTDGIGIDLEFEDTANLIIDKEKTCIAVGKKDNVENLDLCKKYTREESAERFFQDLDACLATTGDNCYCSLTLLNYDLQTVTIWNYDGESEILFQDAKSDPVKKRYPFLFDFGGEKVEAINVGADDSSQVVVYDNLNYFPHRVRLTHQGSPEGLKIAGDFDPEEFTHSEVYPPQKILIKKSAEPTVDAQQMQTFVLRDKKYPGNTWDYLSIIKDKNEADGVCVR